MKILKNLRKNKKGATAIEYGLIAALIGSLSNTFSKVSSSLESANTGL